MRQAGAALGPKRELMREVNAAMAGTIDSDVGHRIPHLPAWHTAGIAAACCAAPACLLVLWNGRAGAANQGTCGAGIFL